ncbi:GNAT family N-acetyltransferase [Nocardiopsis sp. NPDC058631]|uniref:GNAT family N-acetyltransferase n=1 Tax=Nocardiopsis sp. NPDC058631 TaxID=3346566 RepID=UPI0036566CD9
MTADVVDRRDQRRYEITADGEVAGHAEYILTDDMITFTHTEIDPAFEGRGLAGALTRAALDDVRSRGLSVLPLCPYVKGWIQRHREYADLVYRSPSA